MADEDTDKGNISAGDADRAYLVILSALITELIRTGKVDGASLAENFERFAGAIKEPSPGFKQLIDHFVSQARIGAKNDSGAK